MNTGSQPVSSSRPVLLHGAAPPIVLLAAGTIMAWWTWGSWPDVFVDFGRELYLAWQISAGKVLYRDLAYYNGPLSPYLNSIWFRLFGVGLHTLFWCNLVILALFVVLLFSYLRRLSDRFAATVACLFFLLLFAFSQYVGIGNYNYVAPYSHDAVHGLVLSFLTLILVEKYRTQERATWLAGAGFCFGLVFLTRSEVFVALAAAVASAGALPLLLRLRSQPAKKQMNRTASLRQHDKQIKSAVGEGENGRGRSVFVFAIAMLVPAAVAFAALATAMPLKDALRGTLGTWPATLDGRVASLRFFQISMGLENAKANFRAILVGSAGCFAVFLPLTVVSLIMRKPGAYRAVISVIAAAVGAAALTGIGWGPEPYDPARPLPLVMVLACIVCAWRLIRTAHGQDKLPAAVLPFCVFGLVLLGKIILFARISQYGFYLAMPAALFVVLALVAWIPTAIDRRGGFGWFFRGAAIGILTGVAIACVHDSARQLAKKTETTGVGIDQFRSDGRGKFANIALQQIEQFMKAGETLVALPEGVILNYLSRRANPTPHTNFMPTEMVIFGEASILESLKKNPPDWIALIHKDTSEFGLPFFGADYAQSIRQWMVENYREASIIGARPLEDRRKFGVSLWKKN